jgi:hypothetical protein
MKRVKTIHIVYADWCPHCVPTTIEPLKKKAEGLHITLALHNIDDPHEEEKADELVKKYGDWSPDYLIPQIFLEYDSGEIRHVLTGYSNDIQLTRNGVDNLVNSNLFDLS